MYILAKLITKRDRNILTGSKIIEDYLVLKRFIDKTPNWDDRRLNELDNETILFFQNIYSKVLKQATEEWTVDMSSVEYFEGDNMQCELCSQRPIKNICIIENNFTGKKLKIGTECVKHFGIKKDVEIEKLLEQSKRIKGLETLNDIYPGIEREINNWDYFLEKQTILIKKEVSQKYISEGAKAKIILEEYLDTKTSVKRRNKIVESLDTILKNKKIEIKKIEDYVDKNEGNLLIPNRALINRLKSSREWELIEMLEEDGVIRHRTLFRINDEELCKSLVGAINKELKEFNCFVDGVGFDKGLGYIYSYKKKNRIKLFFNHNEFCFNYYNFITGDEGDNIDFGGLINISRIHGENSIENALYELFDLIRNTQFKLEDGIYHEYDNFYVYNKETKSYYELEINSLIKEFTQDLFINTKSTRDKFYNYVLDLCMNPISKKDYDYIIDTRDKGVSFG